MATWKKLFDDVSKQQEEARKRGDFAAMAAAIDRTTVLFGRYREAGRPDDETEAAGLDTA